MIIIHMFAYMLSISVHESVQSCEQLEISVNLKCALYLELHIIVFHTQRCTSTTWYTGQRKRV